MPTYEYQCDACKKGFEIEQRMSDQPVKKCPKCGKLKARRMISGGAGFQLKGGGWYADGYASKGGGAKDSSTTKSADTSSKSSSTSSAD